MPLNMRGGAQSKYFHEFSASRQEAEGIVKSITELFLGQKYARDDVSNERGAGGKAKLIHSPHVPLAKCYEYILGLKFS